MSTIREILKKVGDGSLQPQEAGDQIGQIVQQNLVGGEGDEYKDQKFDSLANRDDENFENSTSLVTAAWIGGTLTDGQYHTIREAIIKASGAEKGEKDASEED